MDVARRLVQIPAEKAVYSAAARVSAFVSELKKDFEQDAASTTIVENLEKMARDEQICNAFMHSDAFQSSMFVWEREFKIPSSSSVAVIEDHSNNNNTQAFQQPFITSTTQFTFPTFPESSSSTTDNSSTFITSHCTSTESTFTCTRSSSPTPFDPELRTYQAPRWNTLRAQRVPISDRIVNYMTSFWKIFFKDQPAKPVVVGQPIAEEIPKSTSTDDFGVPGSPPQDMPAMKVAVAGVAILLMATILRFEFTSFQMTAAEGMEAAHMLVKAFISKIRILFK